MNRRRNPDDTRAQFYRATEKSLIDSRGTMLAQMPIGSKADGAIRGAIIASVARHALAVRDRMSAATAVQKRMPAAH